MFFDSQISSNAFETKTVYFAKHPIALEKINGFEFKIFPNIPEAKAIGFAVQKTQVKNNSRKTPWFSHENLPNHIRN